MPYLYTIGWDVSTSIIGVCVLNGFGLPVFWHKIDLRKCESLVEKYFVFESHVNIIFESFPFFGGDRVLHVIEDRLGGFTKGFTSQNTLLALTAMNAVATFIISSRWRPATVCRYAPISVKSFFKIKVEKGEDVKEKKIEKVLELYPEFPIEHKKSKKNKKTPKDGVADLADAYLLARAGYLVNGREKLNGSK